MVGFAVSSISPSFTSGAPASTAVPKPVPGVSRSVPKLVTRGAWSCTVAPATDTVCPCGMVTASLEGAGSASGYTVNEPVPPS